MDRQAPSRDVTPDSAFGFDGNWKDFAKIALPNQMLTILTLGIYRFWATARERRYLWAHSRFVDERLEWSGTGRELFIGFLLAAAVILLPLFGLNLLIQSLTLRGEEALAGWLTFVLFLGVYYFTGLARFRGLRYRLSRTHWRGIRGGSDDQGLGYGVSYTWKSFVGYLPLGLLVPWSMTSLWNERIGKMSFGPHRFEAHAASGNLFARFLLFYLLPIVLVVGLTVAAFAGYGIDQARGGEAIPDLGITGMLILAFFVWFFVLGLVAAAFYAKYYREVVGATEWADLNFAFEASTMDWIRLYLGDFLLVVATLGIGFTFVKYRHWKFFMTHMEAGGEILLDNLTQSTTRVAGHGEGLLDAFDIGAV